VEARSQGRWGEHLEEVQRYERIGHRVPGNTGPIGTDSPDAQTLVAAGREGPILAGGRAGQSKRHEGKVAWRHVARYWRGKTSESESPWALPA
jgi:hypothetical protein